MARWQRLACGIGLGAVVGAAATFTFVHAVFHSFVAPGGIVQFFSSESLAYGLVFLGGWGGALVGTVLAEWRHGRNPWTASRT
jgi:hypothetical protein